MSSPVSTANQAANKLSNQPYVGRFAPSPSGALHFGSLVTALASYIHARQHQGKWLVRIEDIDPPREQAGAADDILRTLDAYGLHWDGDVFYQSQQSERYRAILQTLLKCKQAYYCTCTRAQIKAHGGIYQGHCKTLARTPENAAIRVINEVGHFRFNDIFQGTVSCQQALAAEDFTVLRKDGLFAYQLAVVADDIEQNISHIIRGADLLEPTARQLSFYQILAQPAPMFGHVPLVVTEQGYKLSKQNKAPAIDQKRPQPSIIAALKFLGQTPPSDLVEQDVDTIIDWAVSQVNFTKMPKQPEIVLSEFE